MLVYQRVYDLFHHHFGPQLWGPWAKDGISGAVKGMDAKTPQKQLVAMKSTGPWCLFRGIQGNNWRIIPGLVSG